MKITPLFLVLFLAAGLTVRAEDEKKSPGAPKTTEKESPAAEGADAAWAEVEPLLKKRPANKAEAKQYLDEYDQKSAAFLKAYPKDARRWKLKIHAVQLNRMRSVLGFEAKSDEELAKSLDEILAAPDADKESKELASFIRVMESGDEPEKFQKLAAAHLKEYPDFRGNSQVQNQLNGIESEKALKEKPLELSFKSTAGKEIDLAKMRGKVVLVDFWATWCGPCIQEIPNVVAAYEKLHDKGFEIVGISFDKKGDEDKLADMTKEKKMPWPQYFDGMGWQNKFGQQFGINSIPRMWLVNKKGMVVDTNAGEDLVNKVEKLLAEK
jgi:thiol-disulfide isomerase/thioredoxin